MEANPVPAIVVGRLPLYLRALNQLAQANQKVTSSQELSERLGFSSAQIRKDLSYFGEFGKQGTGYEIAYLQDQLRRILKVNQVWEMVLVGAGDLGTALAHYEGFERRGFRIKAIFDNDPAKIGMRMKGLVVRPTEELGQAIREERIHVALIAVPAEAAQEVADRLIEAGVGAILNYAPTTLTAPPRVRVYDIDPVVGLQSMTYYL